MAEEDTAIFETPKDAGKGPEAGYRLWTAALDLSSKEEADWRKSSAAAIRRYRDERDGQTGSRFNILYSSVQTQEPALYNSTPAPDVRRRYGDEDPVGKVVAQVYERALSHCLDEYDFDFVMESVIHDSLLPGRGVALVIYDTMANADAVDYESVRTEHIQYDDFRHGPGKTWADVGWIAVRYRITRDEAIALNPDAGATVPLDHTENGAAKDGEMTPSVFKRLTVWKIWDKTDRKIKFLAPSYKTGLFAVEDDILNLKDFFPTPRPIYDVMATDSLVPLVPFDQYKDQAAELDSMTQRISKLIRVLKWRGVKPSEIDELDRLKDAEDGDLVPSDTITTALAAAQTGSLDNLIWIMPIDKLIAVIRELVVQREAVKQVVFEISGMADVMRGETNPNETLGAQQLKAQWGSMRMQRRQREVQRFARDLLRIKAEIIGEHFGIETLSAMTGIQLPTPEQKMQMAQQGQPINEPSWLEVKQVMQSDALRSYRVDIETDSTIMADLSRAQANMTTFVEGTAAFFAAVGPGVESGVFPLDVAVDIYSGMARNFKLGRQAEDALERLGQQAEKNQGEDPQLAQMQAALQDAEQRVQAAEQIAQSTQADAQQKMAELEVKKEDTARRAEIAHLERLRKQADDQASNEIDNRKMTLEEQKYLDERAVADAQIQSSEADIARSDEMAASVQQATLVAEATAQAAQNSSESLILAAQALASAAQQMAENAEKPRVAKIVRGPDGEKTAVSEIVH